jgi:hypothetical protein
LMMILATVGCSGRPPSSDEAKLLDPIGLASAHVTGLGITNYDLSTGEIVAQDGQSWTVSFTDPRAKATGWTPCTKHVRVERKTGAVTIVPGR